MQHTTNIVSAPTNQSAQYQEAWLRRRYRLTAASAAVIAGLVFSNGLIRPSDQEDGAR